MSEHPDDRSGLSSGDPLGGDAEPARPNPLGGDTEPARPDPLGGDTEPERHASGLPAYEPPAAQPGYEGGYASAPPPGALGVAPADAPVLARYTLSGWWARVGAALIDGIIVIDRGDPDRARCSAPCSRSGSRRVTMPGRRR